MTYPELLRIIETSITAKLPRFIPMGRLLTPNGAFDFCKQSLVSVDVLHKCISAEKTLTYLNNAWTREIQISDAILDRFLEDIRSGGVLELIPNERGMWFRNESFVATLEMSLRKGYAPFNIKTIRTGAENELVDWDIALINHRLVIGENTSIPLF